MISSDLPEVIGICDRVLVMRYGSIRATLTGDVLTLSLGRGVLVVRLRDLADRRGSALQAQLLYEPVGDDLPSAGNGAWIGRLAPENQRG